MKTTMTIALLLAGSVMSFSQNLDVKHIHTLEITDNNNAQNIVPSAFDMDSVSDVFQQQIKASSLIELFPQRPFYNNSFKLSSGVSLNTYRESNSMQDYNDSSEHHFQVNGHSPVFAFSQSFAIDSTFSLGYTLGYSQSDITYDNNYYGSKRYFVSINPLVNVYRSYNWEYYVKLNIGLIYYDNNLESVPSDRLQRIFPTGLKMYTGVTLAGVNYFVNDHLAMNAELSVWSAQTLSFGLSYRFFNEKKIKPFEPDFNY